MKFDSLRSFLWKGEKEKIQAIEYPREYFDAQVCFADKWSQLSGERIEDVLLGKTALYRRVTGEKPPKGSPNIAGVWKDLLQTIPKLDRQKFVDKMYQDYCSNPELSQYKPPNYPENDGKHFGFFAFDYYARNPMNGGKNTVKIHFLNPSRGSRSGLDAQFLSDRRAALRKMFSVIRQNHPEAEEVIGGSWLYSIPQYCDSFPPAFTKDMKQLVPPGFESIPNSVPNMVFTGDSVWGQFVNRYGSVRKKQYTEFVARVGRAKTLVELVNAFPELPKQPKGPIQVFYDYLGL